MTLFFLNLLGDYCNPQHRVTSIATAFGPPNFQMEITPLKWQLAGEDLLVSPVQLRRFLAWKT